MSEFQNRTLTCAGCSESFIFTAGEQRYYRDKGYTDPKRCKSCREARKASNEDKNRPRH